MFELTMLLSFVAAGFSHCFPIQRTARGKKEARQESVRLSGRKKHQHFSRNQLISALTFSKPRL
ncbi:hypothetical protein SAMN05660860_00622 [Geoalkalibacter ferrihydriticus]|uniref:Uncharacterized protein n=1 Tax=Geoalkalibacter ferrihydriticus TaxID=392333 RepID=A0A1G9K174_9BACT|nr:hypothetical protein SAMN05660860_00622 [Geoalkalibacter ferrihydriticus]